MVNILNKQQHNICAMEAETISKNAASPKSQMSRDNVMFIIFTLLISGFMFISCGNGKEPETPLEKALNDHEVAYAKLLQKGNDLRKAVESSPKLDVDSTLNCLRNIEANKGKSEAALWKILVYSWTNSYPVSVEQFGIAPLLAEIDKLADEVLKLEAQIAELGGKPRVGQNNAPAYSQNGKYFGNSNLATWNKTLT